MKLNCAIVCEDKVFYQELKIFCKNSPYVAITQHFTFSPKLVEKITTGHFDLCLIESNLSNMDMSSISRIVKAKPTIFMSSSFEVLKCVLELATVDLILKPFSLEKMNFAMEKGYKLNILNNRKEYELFSVAGHCGQMKLKFSDMAVIKADANDPRDKQLVMKDNKVLTLKNCNFDRILKLSPLLIHINRAEVISLDCVNTFDSDSVTLKGILENKREMQLTLSRTFKKEFLRRLG